MLRQLLQQPLLLQLQSWQLGGPACQVLVQ
jgi:hypothetical protein